MSSYKFDVNILELSTPKIPLMEQWMSMGPIERSASYDFQCVCQAKTKNTYYFQNRFTGSIIQVGSSCRKKLVLINTRGCGNGGGSVLPNINYEEITDITEYALKSVRKFLEENLIKLFEEEEESFDSLILIHPVLEDEECMTSIKEFLEQLKNDHTVLLEKRELIELFISKVSISDLYNSEISPISDFYIAEDIRKEEERKRMEEEERKRMEEKRKLMEEKRKRMEEESTNEQDNDELPDNSENTNIILRIIEELPEIRGKDMKNYFEELVNNRKNIEEKIRKIRSLGKLVNNHVKIKPLKDFFKNYDILLKAE